MSLFSLVIFAGIITTVSVPVWFLIKRETKKEEADANKWVQEIKSNGLQVKVNLNDCKIVANQYNEEVEETAPGRVQAMNVLSGNEMSNVKNVTINARRILFTTYLNRKELTFASPIINREKDWLMWKMLAKGETWLYVNPHNAESFYFDLEFLDQ